MSAGIETETGIEGIEALDFHPHLGCEFSPNGTPACGKPAVFIGYHTCCGDSGLFCATCKAVKIRQIEWFVATFDNPVCEHCQAPFTLEVLQFRPLVQP